MLKTYPLWVSIKMFCCGKAHSWINDCTCIVEYKIKNTKYNDENTRICSSTRKRLDRHPWKVCFERQKKSVAYANTHLEKRKILPFIGSGLFVRLVFLIKTTAAHNLPCVLYYFTLSVYLYPNFLPKLIQSIGQNVCVFAICQPRPINKI